MEPYCELNEIESQPGNSKTYLLLKDDCSEYLTVGGIISQIIGPCLLQFRITLTSLGTLQEFRNRLIHLAVVFERGSDRLMVCSHLQ